MNRLPIYSPSRGEGRRCGPCTACCTALAVDAIGKDEFRPCAMLRPGRGGCKVYETRPESCREWKCMWLLGTGEASHRPDKLGIVLDVQWSEPIQAYFLKVFEVRPGAHKTPAAEALIKSIASAGPEVVAVLIRPGGRRSIMGGSPGALDRSLAILSNG